jgi:prepilin-type N-terminal cleavage/methylation domain-containing protein
MAKDRSGFTLIEVLVVLAILGITIPVFLTLSAYTRNLQYEARLRTQATLLAERISEKLLSQSNQLRQQLETQSEIADGDSEPPFTWTSKVRDSTEVPEQVEIIVEVSWRHAGRDHRVEVATYAR